MFLKHDVNIRFVFFMVVNAVQKVTTGSSETSSYFCQITRRLISEYNGRY